MAGCLWDMPHGQKVHGKGQHIKLEGSLLDLSLCICQAWYQYTRGLKINVRYGHCGEGLYTVYLTKG